MSNINAVSKLNEQELKNNISGEASWHHSYRDSCYIYISGLDPRLTEGDIIIVFSQWGSPIDINLVRDKANGVSKGFCFIGYEDQRSTILAVDNANGMKLLERVLRVDHCKNYRPPETEGDSNANYKPTGAEGGGINKFNITDNVKKLSEVRKQALKLHEQRRRDALKRGAENAIKDMDECWAEEFELMLKKTNDLADAEFYSLMKEEKRLDKKFKKEEEKYRKLKDRTNSASGEIKGDEDPVLKRKSRRISHERHGERSKKHAKDNRNHKIGKLVLKPVEKQHSSLRHSVSDDASTE